MLGYSSDDVRNPELAAEIRMRYRGSPQVVNFLTIRRQYWSEGEAFAPILSPDGKKVYYLRRTAVAHSYFSGELWVSDVVTGVTQHLFSGMVLTQFAISTDGKKVVMATEQGQAHSGIWF